MIISVAKEIYEKRSLIYQLVLKDLKTRYSRPFLGFFWAFLAPFLTSVIFYFVFSLILKVRTGHIPFFLYIMSAVFSWDFFQDSLLRSSTSLLQNKGLIRESAFPQYLIPVSIVTANLVNFLPSLALLLIISLFVLKGLPLFAIFLPIVLIIHTCITIGLSVIFSILYVKWRDTKQVLDSCLLLLFYLTPAFYPIQLVKETFTNMLFVAYKCNPLVGILNLYRITALKGFFPQIHNYAGYLSLIIIPLAFAVITLFFAFSLYKKQKSRINDYLSY